MAIAHKPNWHRVQAMLRDGSCGAGSLQERATEVAAILSRALSLHPPHKVTSQESGVHFAWLFRGTAPAVFRMQCDVIVLPRKTMPDVNLSLRGCIPERTKHLLTPFTELAGWMEHRAKWR